MTTTYAKMRISLQAYEDIREELIRVNYVHKIINLGKHDETIVLGDIGLIPTKGCSMPSHHWSCTCNGMGGDR